MDQKKEEETGKNKPNLEKNESCYSYEGNTCIYTDPDTHLQYEWCAEKENWTQRTSSEGKEKTDSTSTPAKFSEDDTGSEYIYNGETYVYTDKKDGVKYSWDTTNNEWIKKSHDEESRPKSVEDACSLVADLKTGAYSFAEDKHYYTDPSDGTVFEWDNEKKAWFPKVDEDFIAHYQMSYGFNQGSESTKTEERSTETKPSTENSDSVKNLLKRKEPPPPPAWFEIDDQHNTKVYVSNLPCDITETEFVELMQKCGLVMKDPDNNRMKVKLYADSEGRFKGDALCTYIKIESVELALNLLDGSDVKGKKIHVERAKFQMKGEAYNANLKPRKKRKKDKEKLRKMQEKLFDWRPDKMRGERPGNERVVVIKNLFEPGLFDKNAALLLEYRDDLREECSKCGNLKKVVIHDCHKEGVAQVYFEDAEEADICVKLLNGRWFGQRRLVAETWDGKTKYRIEETEEEKERRIQNWAKFLESGEGGPGGKDGEDDASATTSTRSPAKIKSAVPAHGSSDVTTVSEGGKDEQAISAPMEKGIDHVGSSCALNEEGSTHSMKEESCGGAPLGNSNIVPETPWHSSANYGHSKVGKVGNNGVSDVAKCHEKDTNNDNETEEVPENEGETDSNPEGDSDD